MGHVAVDERLGFCPGTNAAHRIQSLQILPAQGVGVAEGFLKGVSSQEGGEKAGDG